MSTTPRERASPESPADTYDPVTEPGWPAELGLIVMSVAAAVGMGRLFADASFLPVVLLAVLTSHGLSMLCRRRGVGPLGGLVVSAVGLVLFVTWVIEPHISLVPGMATWHAASVDLREAWGRFSKVVAPAEVSRGFLLGAVLTFVVLAEISAAPRARPWLAGRRRAGESALLRSGLGMAGITLLLAVILGPQLPGAYAKGVLGVTDGNSRKSGTRVTLSPLVDIRGRLTGQSSVELFTVVTETPTYLSLIHI